MYLRELNQDTNLLGEMVLTCAAYGCKSRFVKGSGITFHAFPKDPKRRKLWEIQLKRKNFKATDHLKVCSKHFTEDCFDREKFGGTWLKETAVPTIFNFPEYMKKIQNEFPIKEEPVDEISSTSHHQKSKEKGIYNIEKFKRECFFGDFTENDMECPRKAKQAFLLARCQIANMRGKIKLLAQRNRRLKRGVTTTKETKKKKNLINTTSSFLTSMDEEDKDNILEFLMLVGKLKHLKRTGWVKRNIPECESVAGHMYRMSIMALFLDGSGLLGLDKVRCLKMALIHDIAECIVGDITPFCGVSKEEKHRREVDAMEKLCGLVGEKNGNEIFSLFMEYEEQVTPEAKAVKDLDRFDMILQAFEYEVEMKQPNFLQGFFDNTEGTFTNPLVSKWVQDLKLRREQSKPDIKTELQLNQLASRLEISPESELHQTQNKTEITHV